jgi:hypothetical protein
MTSELPAGGGPKPLRNEVAKLTIAGLPTRSLEIVRDMAA